MTGPYSTADRATLAQTLLCAQGLEPLSHGKRLLAMSQAVEDRHLQCELQNTAFYMFAKAGRKQRADLDLSDIDKGWLKRLDQLQEIAEKEAFILEGIKGEPNAAYRYVELGYLYEDETQQYFKAEEAYRKAIALDPEDTWVWDRLAELLSSKLGKFQQAADTFRKAVRINPKDAWLWNNFGELLADHFGRYVEAERAYRKAIKLDPENAWPWKNLGDLLANHFRRYADAEQAYRKAIELDSENAWPWFGLGDLLKDHCARHAEAKRAYRKAIELDPKNGWPWLRLGDLLRDHYGRNTEAERAYLTAIKVDPENAWPWLSFGTLLEDYFGRHAEAKRAYRKAIELDPKNIWPWLKLGDLLTIHFGRYAEAERAYRKAIELEPDAARSKDVLAWTLYRQSKNGDEAAALARQACDIDPTPSYCHTLACILAWQGSVTESLEWIGKYLAATPGDLSPEGLSYLNYYLRELVHHNQADLGVRLLEEFNRGEAWRPLVEALRAAGKRDRDSLKRINPEQREPAETIYDFFMENLPEPEQGQPKARRKRRVSSKGKEKR